MFSIKSDPYYDRAGTAGRLRRLRTHAGMTQAEVAFLSGITQGALSNYENARREVPVSVLVALASVFQIKPVDLVPGLLEVPPPDRYAALYS